jgi:hypothetical protein
LGLEYSAVCVGAASGSNFDDIYVTGYNNDNYLQYFLRNARNGSFILATADLFGMVPVRMGRVRLPLVQWSECLCLDGHLLRWTGHFIQSVFNYMKNNLNGTFTNLVNSSAAFPGGVPTGCSLFVDGGGRSQRRRTRRLVLQWVQRFISELISRLYLRDANGSMILSTGLDATGTLTQLQYSSSVAVDIDSDGDMDLVVAGENINYAKIMAALLNDGSGNFTDGTPQVFGSLPGFSQGALAVAQFTNDSMPDLIHIGDGLLLRSPCASPACECYCFLVLLSSSAACRLPRATRRPRSSPLPSVAASAAASASSSSCAPAAACSPSSAAAVRSAS